MSQANALEVLMLGLINKERAAIGLAPLRFNGDLNEASEDHSDWMLDKDEFSHTGEGGSSAGDRIVSAGYVLEGNWTWGENIGWQSERGAPGLEDDVRDIHESLMNSPGHRANILNPDYEEIGIGIERGDFRGFDGVMITQNFGTTDATSVEEPAEPEAPVIPEPEVPVVDNDEVPQEDVVDEDPVIVAELPEDETPTDENVPLEDEVPEEEDVPDVVELPDEEPEVMEPEEEVPVAENDPEPESDPEPETPVVEGPEDNGPMDDLPEQEEFAFDLDAFLTDLGNRIEALIEERFRLAFGDNDNFWFTAQDEEPGVFEEDDFMLVDINQGGGDVVDTGNGGCDDYQFSMDCCWNAFDISSPWETAA
ncbi:Cysteine-rich secretory protein family protein [Roseovarius albus]|uniref:Cysteine-rich secretory protein family protein n=1 Tax=Roseovarius albus TaxID=1247867 RepID=A0A1X6Z9D7_9RHOB|nr:CAP domain-containing protein [Roseovarius albus]SLN44159.1 Cysteine-rich secretory protein family protein [Roseovarius albus]